MKHGVDKNCRVAVQHSRLIMQQEQPEGKGKAIKKKSKKTNRRRIQKREKKAHIIGREGSDVICTPLFIALTSTLH